MFHISVGAINHPKLCHHVTWKKIDSTLIDLSSSAPNLSVFAIDSDDRVYVADRETNQVLISSTSGSFLTQINSSRPTSLFVYGDQYILVGSDQSIDLIQLAEPRASRSIDVTGPCQSLFVDRNETVYCSLPEQHRVITLSLTNSSSPPQYSVGSGTCGSASTQLCSPTGLAVGYNFDLYVADTNNDRVQRFSDRSLKGETIVGAGGRMNTTLLRPTALIPDRDGTLFILDSGHRRVVHYFWSGWRCVIGCSATGNEPLSGELSSPTHLAFDQQGNLFVLDQGSRRVEKYQLEGNACCK